MFRKCYFFSKNSNPLKSAYFRAFLLCFFFFNLFLIKFLNFKLMLIFFYSFDVLKEKYLLCGMEELACLLVFAEGEKFTFSFSLDLKLLFESFLVPRWIFLLLLLITLLIFWLFLGSINLNFFFNLVCSLLRFILWGLSFFLLLSLLGLCFILGLEFILQLV